MLTECEHDQNPEKKKNAGNESDQTRVWAWIWTLEVITPLGV